MRKLKSLLAAVLLSTACLTPFLIVPVVATSGCHSPTQQKVAVNTLFSVHKGADVALDAYLDLVLKGTLKTNSMPAVLSAYSTFQSAYNASLVIVLSNSNAVAPQSVLDAAAAFAATVTSAKKGSL